MKCAKCNYTSFDYNDSCPRCGTGLADTRTLLQIIAVSPEDRAVASPPPEPKPEAKAADVTEPPAPLPDVEPAGEVGEDLFEGLDFEESFDDLVERTSYEETPPEAPAGPTEEPADDGLLDLDFGDLFGDESKHSD